MPADPGPASGSPAAARRPARPHAAPDRAPLLHPRGNPRQDLAVIGLGHLGL
ncbi:hypothetical protein G3I40_08410, partial [Streptomyces sp. SID14478]|nr:hypothetical protein [Streptomyces sp. SID14478]